MKFLYEFLKLIPKNKVITYKQLGEIFNLHPRKVAQILKQNTQQDKYPCYKVINSDLTLGGYNLGEEVKKLKLEKDGIKIINNKVSQVNIRRPKFKNFFCAFPLKGKQKIKFKELYKKLEKINKKDFSLRKSSTPHITLRFFGDIDLKKFHKIIENTKKLQITKREFITLSKINHFNEKVIFFEPDYTKNFNQIYYEFHKINNLQFETRPYHPHLTILRLKNPAKMQEIKSICGEYKFIISLNTICFYLAVDNNFQIPIKEITFSP